MNLQQLKTKAEGALSTISTGSDSIAGIVEMLLFNSICTMSS